jgi:hypothetical protein
MSLPSANLSGAPWSSVAEGEGIDLTGLVENKLGRERLYSSSKYFYVLKRASFGLFHTGTIMQSILLQLKNSLGAIL